MASLHKIGRREFIRSTSAIIGAGLGASGALGPPPQDLNLYAVDKAVHKVGRLSRHKLGNSKREVSVIVGALSWSPEATEAGIRCGVNYWHGANGWTAPSLASAGSLWRVTPQAVLKNREAHYCEVLVDRVRGNWETGQIDEEEHYQFVKQAVSHSGLSYFDDMKFHWGFHSVEEYKRNRGFIRAFERLKKEGLVRHLCVSQHGTKGYSRIPGGQPAHEILEAMMEEGIFEHAQILFSYGDDPAMSEFLNRAWQKGFGTIAMKTTRGAGRLLDNAEFMKDFPSGTTAYHAIARWLTTQTKLDAAVIQIANLSQFMDTLSGAGKPMRAADVKAIEQLTAYANREVCRLCTECMSHCERGIPITDILRYERYASDYGERDYARRLYARLGRQANACIACGTCVAHCSQGLCIPEKLAEAHHILA